MTYMVRRMQEMPKCKEMEVDMNEVIHHALLSVRFQDICIDGNPAVKESRTDLANS